MSEPHPLAADLAERAITAAWRQERPVVLASVARRLGDLEEAEDAVQEAFAAATARWPRDGVPERPGAWLTTTAWRKAIDARRRRVVTTTAERRAGGDAAADAEPMVTEDDLLALLLTCCHPALAPDGQVALTLRHVAGLTDAQIAAMFLLPPATLTKRLVRARAKIRAARIGFGVPDRSRLTERVEEVRTVIYLIFTAGYSSSVDGPTVRADVCDEAVWLALQLHRLLPDDDETTGLAALLLLQNSRAAARSHPSVEAAVAYTEQDRGRWDGRAVAQAKALLATTAGTPPGAYRIEAAIALMHATAPDPLAVDWPMISRLYDILVTQDSRPAVAINRAVAHGRVYGAARGLQLLQTYLEEPQLSSYLPLYAAHAQLLTDSADPDARQAWLRAASLAPNTAQRVHLERRADTISTTPSAADSGPVGRAESGPRGSRQPVRAQGGRRAAYTPPGSVRRPEGRP